MGRFSGKVALVTGGSAGIGETVAQRLAAEGAKVAIAGRNQTSGDAAVSQIQASGGEAVFFKADVSVEDDVARLVADIIKRFGDLDIAFNNAGAHFAGALIHETPTAEYRRIMAVDVDGVFYCMKHQIRHFLKRGGGVIVNCASIAGMIAIKGNGAYVGAKHAVVGLTKAAALDYATNNIRVNAVCPGATMTPMVQAYIESAGQAATDALIAQHPIGRAATTDEVANLVLWLASDESSYMLGQSIAVDGGATIL